MILPLNPKYGDFVSIVVQARYRMCLTCLFNKTIVNLELKGGNGIETLLVYLVDGSAGTE